FDYSLLPASVVPNVRAAAQQRQHFQGHPPSSDTPPIRWQPVSPSSPTPTPVPPVEVSDLITGPIPTPTPPEDIPASSLAAPSPSEIVLPSTAPDEMQEIEEASQAQVDENGPDTVVVKKPKNSKQRSRVQQPSEIVQAEDQSQEETPGEPGTNEEDSQSAI